MDRETVLQAVADRVYSFAHDGESAPDYRWLDQYIDWACQRYKVTLTMQERAKVSASVRRMG